MNRKLQQIMNENRECSNLIDEISNMCESAEKHIEQIEKEEKRFEETIESPKSFVDDIDKAFRERTRLDGKDVKFLFLAASLQIIRQILQKKITFSDGRPDDKEASLEAHVLDKKLTESVCKEWGISKEEVDKIYKNRKHRYYNPSLAEILANPVPFDANIGAPEGAIEGFGYLGHRGATPGHDPILGLIFGTANIATSTLTNWNMRSYHIYSGELKGKHYTQLFGADAKIDKIFQYTFDKLFNQGIDGKIIIGISLAKEVIHLKSDVHSKNSLPLPIVSAISPKFAGNLAKHGFDMANALYSAPIIGRQAKYAIMINTIISILHGLFYSENSSISYEEYTVKTKRILVFSNLIASTINIVCTTISKDVSNLDIGGIAVTLYRLISDNLFISKVKEEFIKNEMYNRITGEEYDFMKGER